MSLWDMLKGPRKVLKKVKVIYNPYRKIKGDYLTRKGIKALHNDGVNTIDAIEKALMEYGIVFFADCGTLLGIIRDHDFIPWDSDMDYGIVVDNSFDWKKFEEHMNQCGFHKILQFCLQGKITEQAYSWNNNALKIDFFAKLHEDQKLVSYIYYRKPEYEYSSDNDCHVRKMKYAVVHSTKRLKFKGTYVTVPENAEQYLESVYSKSWRTPDPVCDVYSLGVELEEMNTFGRVEYYK